jgi:hypothetical protein
MSNDSLYGKQQFLASPCDTVRASPLPTRFLKDALEVVCEILGRRVSVLSQLSLDRPKVQDRLDDFRIPGKSECVKMCWVEEKSCVLVVFEDF